MQSIARRFTMSLGLFAASAILMLGASGGTAHADDPAMSISQALTISRTNTFNPVYGQNGVALEVFPISTMADINADMLAAQASGAWVQNARGEYVLYILGAPAFVNQSFFNSYPNGWAIPLAVSLIQIGK